MLAMLYNTNCYTQGKTVKQIIVVDESSQGWIQLLSTVLFAKWKWGQVLHIKNENKQLKLSKRRD